MAVCLDGCSIGNVRFRGGYSIASEGAVVPPAVVLPTHRSGRCRIIGASRRPGHPNRPPKARTPARPDGAILKPPAPPRGGLLFSHVSTPAGTAREPAAA